MPVVFATAPTIPMNLLNRVFVKTWTICHSVTYCMFGDERETRGSSSYFVLRFLHQKKLHVIFSKSKFWLEKKTREEF